VRTLLARDDANPDTREILPAVALFAAEKGHEGDMRILLGRNDVNPNTADAVYRQSPLWFAVVNEHEGIQGYYYGTTSIPIFLTSMAKHPSRGLHRMGMREP